MSKSANTPKTGANSIVWHFQWVRRGQKPLTVLNAGKNAGFHDYFINKNKDVAQFYIGVTGTQRFEVSDWLRKQAQELGFDQYIIESVVALKHTFKERINGKNDSGELVDEFELTKPVIELREKLAVAWSKIVMSEKNMQEDHLLQFLTAATQDANSFLPINANLFSQTIENMDKEIRHANAIIFPALPLNHKDWKNKPIKLIAFQKSTVVNAVATWDNKAEVVFA